MKASVRTIATASVLLASFTLKAQVASVFNAVEPKQKILVDFKISPSVEGFRAGLSVIDSAENKFRLWVCNSEEKKCMISISSSTGYVWTDNFKDAYYNQVFNLASLDDGEYTVRVACGKDLFERRITISTGSYVRRELRVEAASDY